ncbi:efflux RND transporter permease subunit [Desulfopila sp. IMCC35006]|uniref:efflux RND transporter permease subunit n=1 Tax=Desulfopila sp. IMCC35006 TaxID=2569542 RepID=UPI0010AC6E8B|nr:efflux RND transporter permease subunit [Desulfopila sp. IMCC35006]TKB28385.1 efflux RND transporter permease subunit [Desulfopila sp. IMCC35006]
MTEDFNPQTPVTSSWLGTVIRFCMLNRMIVFLAVIILIGWGLVVAPFDWHLGGMWRDPVPVDAIPDVGENQQIVFADWTGRSPQDIEDQITYPLSASLLGVPGVKTIRSYSMFGFSMVYVIFEDGVDFYWARTRVLEKLNSLPAGELPEGVKPTLGPDATALGQVFWYTLEGIGPDGKPSGGWDLHELRTIQDWYVRYGLMSVPGVSEVGSVGGFVMEYQIDVDPDLLRYHGINLAQVVDAVRRANVDVGARTIEVNKVEYVIRGLGFFKSLDNIRDSLIKLQGETPILVGDVAHVSMGPASRSGVLDKSGAEAVGGVVVVRYGENPLAVINRVKKKIDQISLGLPKRTLADGTLSQVKIVPFYDRTELIKETLGTLNSALSKEMLVTIIVVLVMMAHLGSSIIISGLLPLAVLLCFIAMKIFHVDANIVALSGIAIAIGTIVDMGIILTENILRRLAQAAPAEDRAAVILRAAREVGGAVLTAVSTTIVSFLPVFTMVAAEGKLFRPLAFTKTFTLLASLILALCVIPPLAHALFNRKPGRQRYGWIFYEGLIYLGALLAFTLAWQVGLLVAVIGGCNLVMLRLPTEAARKVRLLTSGLIILGVAMVLTRSWQPLGVQKGLLVNFVFVGLLIGGILTIFLLFQRFYPRILEWCLEHKALFLALPLLAILLGGMIWQGYGTVFGWLPRLVTNSTPSAYLAQKFPGLGKEFMPPLDEGAYLYMPVTMPHASIGEVLDILQRQDRAIEAIPEVESAVGKLGRVESPLDPAPTSMIETLINYTTEFRQESDGQPARFRFNPDELDFFRDERGHPLPAPDGKPYHVRGKFERDDDNKLIPDDRGSPFRLWRPALNPEINPGRNAWAGIRQPDDIWQEIVKQASIPGTTVAPKLQPISARIVMLQSGIRANMGVKVNGPDLQTIEEVTGRIEKFLREVPSVDPLSVIADRIVGKPYLEINIDRRAIAQYGIDLQQVQDVIEIAIGGKQITTTVQGRERYPVRVRYMRELRDHLDTVGEVMVSAPNGAQIPLVQLADLKYVAGPQMIKSENTSLVGYVLFDKKTDRAETNVVEEAQGYLLAKIQAGELHLPAGVSFSFTGNYENQVRADKKLGLILPLALLIIFFILYLQFKSIATSALVFSGVAVAWAGGFIMIWLYGQPWFLDFSVFGTSMRELFQVHPINLSVAVWVGFLALFGIASDDGVVMATYLDSAFAERKTPTAEEIRRMTIEACMRRVRPCLMTTATTVLALVPVLTSTGRGADIMLPMAIPTLGGMSLAVMTMLVVPVLYCGIREMKLKRATEKPL